MNKIVVVGSSNTDMVVKADRLPAPGETVLGGEFIMNPGGKGANQAVAAARLGGEVVFVARVGDDLFGKESVRGFARHGINTEYVSIDPDQPSGVASIMVDQSGENCIAVASGANNALSPSHIDAAVDAIDNCDVLLLQLETPLATIEHVVKLGRKLGKTVILNPAPAQDLSDTLLGNVDILTPNETEAKILTGINVEATDEAHKAAQELCQRGVATVILTLGSRGAYIESKTFTGIIPAPPVEAVDTTAAGDTFNGALAVAVASGKEIHDAVSFANKAASISVTRLGAQTAIPKLDELS